MSDNEISRILIDWGTSSFRIWGVDQIGDVLFENKAPLGMSKLNPSDYESLLENVLLEFEVPKNIPVLICGMAGAAQGWQEAKYIDLPTRLENLSSHAIKVQTQTRDVRILPGLAQRSSLEPDVMRGEETLLLGALAKGYSYESYCMPGTHSKWVQVANGEVQAFKTFMTGELFAILGEHSTLSHFIDGQDGALGNHPGFESAVKEIASKPDLLINTLFSIRSGSLLFSNEDAGFFKARLSGLLIGAELSAMKTDHANKIGLIGRGETLKHYSSAMGFLGMGFDIIDSHALAVSGLKSAADELWLG